MSLGGSGLRFMQRWLKRITPQRHALEKLWCLKPFTALVRDRGCWKFTRTSVVRAFSLGLLIAFIPPTPLPLHLTLCALARYPVSAEFTGAVRDGLPQQSAHLGPSSRRLAVGRRETHGHGPHPAGAPDQRPQCMGATRSPLAAAAARSAGARPRRGRTRLRARARRVALPE